MVLEIVFSGLIAFLKGSCTLNNAQTMRIVMVKGVDEAHESRLLIDVMDVDASSSPPDEILEIPGEKRQFAVWSLENRLIKFVDRPRFQIYEGNRKPEKPKPGGIGNKKNDFSWAPEMHKSCGLDYLHPRAAVMDESLLTYKDVNGAVVQFAAARVGFLDVDLTGPKPGNADNQLETDIGEDEPMVFKFRDDAKPYKQAVADRARLKLLRDKDSFTIELWKPDLTKPDKPSPPKLDKTIVVTNKRRKDKSDAVLVSISNFPTMLHDPPVELTKLGHWKEYKKLFDFSGSPDCPIPEEVRDFASSKAAGPIKCAICADCGP